MGGDEGGYQGFGSERQVGLGGAAAQEAVASATPAPPPAEPADPGGKVACPECGKVLKPQGLGIHRSKMHGVPGTARKPAKKKPGRRAKGAATPLVSAGALVGPSSVLRSDLGKILTQVSALAQEAAGALETYRVGLGEIVGANKTLRHELIKSRDELRKLRKEWLKGP